MLTPTLFPDTNRVPEMAGQLTTVKAVCEYMLAGNATFTLRSKVKGTRFTYKTKKADKADTDKGDTWFVSLLNGPDNEGDFCYMGIITIPTGTHAQPYQFRFTAKSTVKADAPSAKAFVWFFQRIMHTGTLSPQMEVWHEGQCGRCGRKLTVPESVVHGIGPECAEKM